MAEPAELTERKKQHRAALKDKVYQTGRKVKELEDELKFVEATLLGQHPFKCSKSDTKARNAELYLLMREDPRAQELNEQLKVAEREHHEADKALSEMHYFQRERLIEAARSFRESTETMGKGFETFMAAASLYAEARNGKPQVSLDPRSRRAA